MNRILNKSQTSIEEQFQQSFDSKHYNQWISGLKQKNQTLTRSLLVAEELISTYMQENKDLKCQNLILATKVSDLTQEVQYLKQLLMKDHDNKMEDKIANIAIRNEQVQKKMNNLMDQLQKNQAKVAKLTRIKQQKAQKMFHNHLQYSKPNGKGCQKQQQLNQQIRSLKWKLKQKEQEIIFMIKRNKILEEKQAQKQQFKTTTKKNNENDRFHTCETDNSKILL